ncbi:MAG TPA: hypothetical protein VJ183_11915 [Chloroflexia bacterium]|nr:hypothetical protein [Chloroflexia bacterium]
MGERAWLLRYAAIALAALGSVEWLLGRTVSRMSASPALEGTPRDIIEGIGQVGIKVFPLAFIAAVILFFLAILDLGERAIRKQLQREVSLAMYLSLFGTLTIVAPFFPTTNWMSTTYNIVSFVALAWVGLYALTRRTLNRPSKLSILIVLLAYIGWFYYILQQALAARWGWEGVPVLVLNLGEILALATPLAFFAAIALPGGQWKNVRRWVLPVVAALLFAAGNIADMAVDQGFTGVFTLWSVGFTHFLPWPIYALAFAAFIYSILTCFSRAEGKAEFANPNTGLGLLLLLFAGYNLQLTYQHLLALIAMLLFAGIARPFSMDHKEEAGKQIAMHDSM